MPRMNSTPQKYSRPTNVFKTLARLFKYFGKKKYLLILVVILVIYTSFANIYGSYMLGQVIDTAIKNEDSEALLISTLSLIGIYGAGAICDLAYTQIMVRLSQSVLFNLRKELSIHNQNLPLSYFDQHNHGEIMSYFTNDVDTLVNALNDSFANIVLSFCNIVGTIVVLLLVNVYLALLVYVFMIGIAFFIFFNTKNVVNISQCNKVKSLTLILKLKKI